MNLFHAVKQGARAIWLRSSSAVVVVVTLGLVTGAGSAIFAVLYATLLKPFRLRTLTDSYASSRNRQGPRPHAIAHRSTRWTMFVFARTVGCWRRLKDSGLSHVHWAARMENMKSWLLPAPRQEYSRCWAVHQFWAALFRRTKIASGPGLSPYRTHCGSSDSVATLRSSVEQYCWIGSHTK